MQLRFVASSVCTVLALSFAAGSSSCQSTAHELPTVAASLTGWELYSWPGEKPGVWLFALLPGTNRVKSSDEIRTAAARVRGLNKLLAELDRLPAGEFVFWCAPRAPGQPATSADFPLPPPDLREAILTRAEQRRLVLALP